MVSFFFSRQGILILAFVTYAGLATWAWEHHLVLFGYYIANVGIHIEVGLGTLLFFWWFKRKVKTPANIRVGWKRMLKENYSWTFLSMVALIPLVGVSFLLVANVIPNLTPDILHDVFVARFNSATGAHVGSYVTLMLVGWAAWFKWHDGVRALLTIGFAAGLHESMWFVPEYVFRSPTVAALLQGDLSFLFMVSCLVFSYFMLYGFPKGLVVVSYGYLAYLSWWALTFGLVVTVMTSQVAGVPASTLTAQGLQFLPNALETGSWYVINLSILAWILCNNFISRARSMLSRHDYEVHGSEAF